eukprot:Pompholyxophrys_punicea_v1_NODE_624_length_1571_cov_3.364776.p2 type:complete len:134 gc:universal NODE_624_length_1571_cov_3.364776:1111-710(-)
MSKISICTPRAISLRVSSTRLTSSDTVPEVSSPRHFNQNCKLFWLSNRGGHPSKDAPGMSASVKMSGFMSLLMVDATVQLPLGVHGVKVKGSKQALTKSAAIDSLNKGQPISYLPKDSFGTNCFPEVGSQTGI